MSFQINEMNLSLETKEVFTFEGDVQSIYDDIIADYEFEYENGDYDAIVRNEIKELIDYELTNKDKIDILEKIKDDYEYELYRSDCEVSIFDVDGIRKSVNEWIKETFELETVEVY
jgi:hypothetical protein